VHRQATPALTTPLLDELATAPVHAIDFADVLVAGSAVVRPGVPTLLVTTRQSDAATLLATPKSGHDARQIAWLRGVEIVAARSPNFADYLTMPKSAESAHPFGASPALVGSAAQQPSVTRSEARAHD
jgi:hypothetical protein